MSVFKIPDMSCDHCEKAIREVLLGDNQQVKIDVNLKEKTISVENLPDDRVIFLLEEIGHTLEKVK